MSIFKVDDKLSEDLFIEAQIFDYEFVIDIYDSMCHLTEKGYNENKLKSKGIKHREIAEILFKHWGIPNKTKDGKEIKFAHKFQVYMAYANKSKEIGNSLKVKNAKKG